MPLDHGLHYVDVVGDVNLGALQLIKIAHALGLAISRDDDLDVLGKVAWEPEGDVALLGSAPVEEVVNAFEDEYDLIVDSGNILYDLVLDALVAHVQPVGEVLPELLLVQLHLLTDVEFLAELNEDPVDGVEIVAIIAPRSRKVQDY